MLNETLSTGLENYRIGPKIRSLRSDKGLGLAQLGSHTGLSAGMLSKIERGTVFPTLPTLLRISMVFGVGLDHFFTDAERPVLEVVRSRDRLRLPNTNDRVPSFVFESLDFPVNDRPINSYLAEFQPRTAATDSHEHAGIEFLYVISGRLVVTVDGRECDVMAGDSMYFDGQQPHHYQCAGDERATVLVVLAGTAEAR